MLFPRKSRSEIKLLNTLRTFSKEMGSILHLKGLLKNLLRALVEISGARSGTILLLEEEIKSFVVRESVGGDPLVLQFSTQDPLINYLGQTTKVMTKRQLVRDTGLIDIKDSGLKFMTSVNAAVVFPMLADKKFIGLLALDSRANGDDYSPSQIDLLEILISMGAIAVDNAILYESLTRQNIKLSEIAKLKTQFVSTITHELSTPLNGIMGLTQVLLDSETSGPLSDDQRRYIQMIASAGEELSDVVNQILELTRFQSKQGALEVKRVNLAQTVEGVRADLAGVFTEKGIQFQAEVDNRTVVYGDEGQIRQVVQSLLENAIKFSPEGSEQRVGIHAGKHGDMLKICIYDRGIGIQEKDQELIFDEFRQADGEHTRSYGGTGLGLALAKRIVELHGGRIWVESKKGEGAQFYFTLPLKPGQIQAPEIDHQRH